MSDYFKSYRKYYYDLYASWKYVLLGAWDSKKKRGLRYLKVPSVKFQYMSGKMDKPELLCFAILEWQIWASDTEAKSEGQILNVYSHHPVHQGEEWQFAPAAELPSESGAPKKKNKSCKSRVLPQHCTAESFRENQS